MDRITGIDDWPVAPRILEDVYSVADAVVFGNLLISLIRHADRVTSASLAQLVNVIAPIMTEPGGAAWRQTTFFPFAETSRLARGDALTLKLTSDTYETKQYGVVNVVDAVATHDDGATSVFLVNRGREEAEVTIDIRALGAVSVLEAKTLSDGDIYASNTMEQPERVALAVNSSAVVDDGTVTVTLPAVSWSVLALG